MLLSLKDVVVHYEKVAAIKGVSLDIDEGTIVTMIGANGAGKTTTLRAISGLKKPTTGEVWFNGARIDGLPTRKIVQLGVAQAPEGRRLFPDMTVLENLKMGAYLRKDRDGISKDLEQVCQYFPILKERAGQRAGTLSGGQQQMLAIARALMSKPKLLLLDEPSLGLSPLIIKEIGNMIKTINQTGVSIILVEQNAQLALRISQKGYVMETGKIVLEGETGQLINNEYVKKAYLGT